MRRRRRKEEEEREGGGELRRYCTVEGGEGY